MIINYLDIEIKFTQKGKLQQSMKLNEWARNEYQKNRGIKYEINGTR